MAAEKPLKVDNGKTRRFESGDFVPVIYGGTGLTTVAAQTLLGAEALDTVAALGLGAGLSISSGTLNLDAQLADIATISGWSKGDLLVFNGSNLGRLPVGTNGQVLTADR